MVRRHRCMLKFNVNAFNLVSDFISYCNALTKSALSIRRQTKSRRTEYNRNVIHSSVLNAKYMNGLGLDFISGHSMTILCKISRHTTTNKRRIPIEIYILLTKPTKDTYRNRIRWKKRPSQHSAIITYIIMNLFFLFFFRGAIDELCVFCQVFSIVVVAVVGFVLFFYLMGKSTPLHSILVINKNAFYLVKLSEILIHIYIFIAWLWFIPDSQSVWAVCVCVCLCWFVYPLCSFFFFFTSFSDYF